MGKKVTVSEQDLARFLAIKQEMKRLEKECKAIQSQIEAAGGDFETEGFIVSTSRFETNRVCGAEELLEKVGFVECNNLGLIKTTQASRLNVERKELAQKAS